MKVFAGIVLFLAFVGGLVFVARAFGGGQQNEHTPSKQALRPQPDDGDDDDDATGSGNNAPSGPANTGPNNVANAPNGGGGDDAPKAVALPALFVVKDGKQLALAGARKKPMLLHLWASWCGPCRQELPSLLAFGKKGTVDVVAVSVDDYWDPVVKFFKGNIPPEVVWDQKITLERALGVDSIPTSFLVDTRGFVVDRFDGAQDWTNPALAKAVDDDLRAPPTVPQAPR